MTIVVAFVSQKGGVGKSTLSRGLAVEAAKNGFKVKIADLDHQQGTSVEWNRRRHRSNLELQIEVESFKTAALALPHAPRYDMFIVDGPARTSEATLEIARAAHLVIQPSGPSLDDLEPAIKEFHALVRAGEPRDKLVIALNRVGTAVEERNAREYIERAGYQAWSGALRDKAGYRVAMNQGAAITEVKAAKLRDEAQSAIKSLVELVLRRLPTDEAAA